MAHTEWSQSESSQESCVHDYTEKDAGNTTCKYCGKEREMCVFTEDRPIALSGPNEGRMTGENLRPDQNDFSHTDSFYTHKKLQEIKRLGSKMKLPYHIIQGSQRLYRDIKKRKYIRSAFTNSMATYIHCKNDETNQLMFFDFIENLDVDRRYFSQLFFKIAKKDILYRDDANQSSRICKKIAKNNTKVMMERFYDELFPKDPPADKQTIINDAEIFYMRMDKNMIDIGRNPRGLYGAALFLASKLNGKHISIHDVANKVKMSVITIRTRLTELNNTPETDQILDCYLTTPVEEWDTNSLPPCMSTTPRTNPDPPSNQQDDIDEISDTSYSIHGLHDSGDEISLCSDDENDVETYLLSPEEVEHKTKLWEEMYSDYTPAAKKRYKTPFTAEKYHTIPRLFSQAASISSSQSPSHSQESQISSPARSKRRLPKIPIHGNHMITDFFSSVRNTPEIESIAEMSPIPCRPQTPCEDDQSTCDDNFTNPQENPYMTPPDSEDDSLNFELADNDPNFVL